MRILILVAALAALAPPSGAAAAEPTLPDNLWDRAVACSAHLFVVMENLENADNQTEDSRDVGKLLNAAGASWFFRAEELPGRSPDEFTAAVDAYHSERLTTGPAAFDSDTRIANLEVCVDEAIDFEVARDEATPPSD